MIGATDCSSVNIYEFDGEFWVYKGEKLIRVCPSIGMAREVASGLWTAA